MSKERKIPRAYKTLTEWCVDLAKEGKTRDQIVKITGCHPSTAYRAIAKVTPSVGIEKPKIEVEVAPPSKGLPTEEEEELPPLEEEEEREEKEAPPAREEVTKEEVEEAFELTEEEVKAFIEFPFDMCARITDCEELMLTEEEEEKLEPLTRKVLNKYLPEIVLKFGDAIACAVCWIPLVMFKVKVYKDWRKEQKEREKTPEEKPEARISEEKPKVEKETKEAITKETTPVRPPILPPDVHKALKSPA